jgi:hypothetical protein
MYKFHLSHHLNAEGTLVKKSWYGSHHSFAGGGRRQTNNINSGVMAHLGQYYKMDDKEIRTYMGQPDPSNDDRNAGDSEMTFMRDQSGRHTSYSNSNREYTIMHGACVLVIKKMFRLADVIGSPTLQA